MLKLERIDRLINKGEIMLQSAEDLESLIEDDIWDTCTLRDEIVEVRREWDKEVLDFLEDSFGIDSSVYNEFKQNQYTFYNNLKDEIEEIKTCLDILYTRRQDFEDNSSTRSVAHEKFSSISIIREQDNL
jgi:hypothetical protein